MDKTSPYKVEWYDVVLAYGTKSMFLSRPCNVSDYGLIWGGVQKNVGPAGMTRVGLHCAPRAHKTLGTFPQGTVRFSFGPENTVEEVELCLRAIRNILK